MIKIQLQLFKMNKEKAAKIKHIESGVGSPFSTEEVTKHQTAVRV
jgi:hypothetical protein